MEGILQSIRNLHTATAQNEIQPIEGKKKKKKFKKIVLNIWENLRHEPSDLSSIEQIMVFICHRINRAV